MEKVKRQLDARRFSEFRQSIAAFMRGDADARAYHKTVETLGLAHLVPEMASLLPDPSKRAALLGAHEAASTSSSRYSTSAQYSLCSVCFFLVEDMVSACEQ